MWLFSVFFLIHGIISWYYAFFSPPPFLPFSSSWIIFTRLSLFNIPCWHCRVLYVLFSLLQICSAILFTASLKDRGVMAHGHDTYLLMLLYRIFCSFFFDYFVSSPVVNASLFNYERIWNVRYGWEDALERNVYISWYFYFWCVFNVHIFMVMFLLIFFSFFFFVKMKYSSN
jgi:hypothetical protein